MFFISALAETNRIPFDLPEAESELVSGYNVEYASTTFVLFFLAEYSNILIMSTLIIISLFILFLVTLSIYFYDQLINFGLKVLFPLALANFFFYSIFIFLFF